MAGVTRKRHAGHHSSRDPEEVQYLESHYPPPPPLLAERRSRSEMSFKHKASYGATGLLEEARIHRSGALSSMSEPGIPPPQMMMMMRPHGIPDSGIPVSGASSSSVRWREEGAYGSIGLVATSAGSETWPAPEKHPLGNRGVPQRRSQRRRSGFITKSSVGDSRSLLLRGPNMFMLPGEAAARPTRDPRSMQEHRDINWERRESTTRLDEFEATRPFRYRKDLESVMKSHVPPYPTLKSIYNGGMGEPGDMIRREFGLNRTIPDSDADYYEKREMQRIPPGAPNAFF